MRDFIRLIKPTQELSAKTEQKIATPILGLASVLPRVLQAAIRIVQMDDYSTQSNKSSEGLHQYSSSKKSSDPWNAVSRPGTDVLPELFEKSSDDDMQNQSFSDHFRKTTEF